MEAHRLSDDISLVSYRCRVPAALSMQLLQQLVVGGCMWSLSSDKTPADAHAYDVPYCRYSSRCQQVIVRRAQQHIVTEI
jgi:hypothetical protein